MLHLMRLAGSEGQIESAETDQNENTEKILIDQKSGWKLSAL